jgi:glycosyltransferase involved in cell wall biosynthesis
MACGRPVVSFDVCSAHEILKEKSGGAGVVLPLGDYAGMAEALVRYACNVDARAAAGHAGSAAARALFDADQVVERYERVYRELEQD